MMRFTSACAVLAAIVSTTVFAEEKAASKLEGTYTIVSGEKSGQPIPEDRLKGSTITVEGSKVYGSDKDKKDFFGATFSLDSSVKPMKISMTSTAPKAGEKASGVISIEGDTVKICYALPNGETPTEFSTKEKQHCFVLKRTGK